MPSAPVILSGVGPRELVDVEGRSTLVRHEDGSRGAGVVCNSTSLANDIFKLVELLLALFASVRNLVSRGVGVPAVRRCRKYCRRD
jgi:hypothetical protein